MKSLLLVGALCAAPALAQPTAPPIISAPAKFSWKLRLTKGQTWTQTVETRTHNVFEQPDPVGSAKTKMDMNIAQIFVMKSEVLDATPTLYRTRFTYQHYTSKSDISINGKAQPAPKMPGMEQFMGGASFTVKQTPDGRVTDVTGLEEFVAREKKLLASLAKTPSERASLEATMPSAAALRESLSKNQSLTLPKAPLSVGDSYAYAPSLPSLPFFTSAKASSKRTLRSFDGQTAVFDETGNFSLNGTAPQVVNKIKMYMEMTASISGSTTVQASSGLLQSSHLTTHTAGKITIIDAAGKHTTMPIDATSETTITTQF